MIRKAIKYLLVLGVVVLVGCRSNGPAPTDNTIITDSTTVQVRERQEAIELPGAVFTTELEILCDPITMLPYITDPAKPPETKGHGINDAEFEAYLEGSRLKISYIQDSLTHLVTLKDSIINRFRNQEKSTHEVIYVHKPKWYDKPSYAVTLLALLYVLYQSRGAILKLLKKTLFP